MSAVKTLTVSVCAWLFLASTGLADPISTGSNQWKWTSWVPRKSFAAPFVPDVPTAPIVVPSPSPPVVPPPAPAPLDPGSIPVAATSVTMGTSMGLISPPTGPAGPQQTSDPAATFPQPPSTVIQPPPPTDAIPAASTMVLPAQSDSSSSLIVPTASYLATTQGSSNNTAPHADAFINFGNGPFPEANMLTTGNAQPWYVSPAVAHVFGGQPTPQQQADFANGVLQHVEQTFQQSGLSPALTIDPTVQAAHTLSVVSNTSFGQNPAAIGITDVGANGFGFIDKLSQAQSVDQLEWAVAHNVSHELMHAFGVAVHHDTTGNFLDAGSASWSLLTDPQATFSPAAVQDMLARNFGMSGGQSSTLGAQQIDGDQTILPQPVPEPTTIAIWGLVAGAAAWRAARRKRA